RSTSRPSRTMCQRGSSPRARSGKEKARRSTPMRTSRRWRGIDDQQGALPTGRQSKGRDQNMAKKEKPSTHDEADSVVQRKTAIPPSLSLARESLELNLSDGQRQTILKYAELPPHLSEELAGKGTAAKVMQFTLDELDELLDHVEQS